MSACLPDRETIHTALSLATRAPSVDDSQPWLWRVDDASLHLYANPDQRGPGTDGDSRDVLLSCGASLNHLVIALAALGWRAKVQRLPDVAEPTHLAAFEFFRHPASTLDVVLASAIPRQRIDWRPYSSWPVPSADLALIAARAARAGVTTRRVETVPDVQRIVAQAVWRERQRSGSTVASPFGDSAAAHQPANDSADGNAVVLALGTKNDSQLARLRAGEAMSLVLLSATALGLASCPVPESLGAGDARDAVHANLFDIVGVPQILLRLGWPPVGADPLPSSPRRPVVDVCEWLGDQSLTSA
jgi:nitroreductase